MNKLATTLIVILVMGIVFATVLYSMNKASNASPNTPEIKVNYTTIGTIKVYNTSALSPFLSPYVNVSYVKLISQVVEYGIINFIKMNSTKGIIGYFKGGVLSSFAFSKINQTLVSHGFKYAEYNSLLYDYNNKTAVGFDGNYFYIVHQNSPNVTMTIDLLYYLYSSNKTFSPPSNTNLIATGTFHKGNFTAYSQNSQIVIKAYFKGNLSKLDDYLRFFNFTTSNFTVEGKVIFHNSTVEVYSLNAVYNGSPVYMMSGFKEIVPHEIYAVSIISSEEINISEVLSML